MDRIKPDKAMKELTMILMYLSRFHNRESFSADDWYAWKGYDFDVINKLADDDYIRQGSRPSRSKSVYITEDGINLAKDLMAKYNIADWE